MDVHSSLPNSAGLIDEVSLPIDSKLLFYLDIYTYGNTGCGVFKRGI